MLRLGLIAALHGNLIALDAVPLPGSSPRRRTTQRLPLDLARQSHRTVAVAAAPCATPDPVLYLRSLRDARL